MTTLRPTNPQVDAPLLEVQDLAVRFGGGGLLPFLARRDAVVAVKSVSFALGSNQTLGLVGESGCGKTTVARAILALERPTSGHVRFAGRDVHAMARRELRAYRRSVQPIFQDPYSSLNPRLSIATILGEPLKVAGEVPARERRRRCIAALESVGLDEHALARYPYEFSGGQCQRIAIARALTVEPRLLILDEPVAALDVSIRAQVVNLLQGLKRQKGLSYLLISHDLDLVTRVADSILVMYLGTVMEMGPAKRIAAERRHPYTQALFAAKLPSHPKERRRIAPLHGELPSPIARPTGCPFHPRCPRAFDRCRVEEPHLRSIGGGHVVACHLA
jgi:oligopeptide/dipeptide ABC transporter ATP-binding protein